MIRESTCRSRCFEAAPRCDEPLSTTKKQPFPRPIGFLCQHLLDQPAKGFNTGPRFTAAHDIAPADVPGGQILQGTLALVFVLNIGRSTWRGRQGGMATAAGL